MLKNLFIKNYAIIDELNIPFTDGLNIITGETGAGKSIILGALGLILGDRADHSTLFNADKKCIIRGEFNLNGNNLKAILNNNDIDLDHDEIIIQREISSKGKSRAYINDTPVNLKTLTKIGQHMVDMHTQFEQLDILKRSRQFEIVDAFSGLRPMVSRYQVQYHTWTEKKKQLAQLKEEKNNALREYDYIKFQADELEKAHLILDEEFIIEDSLSMQTHAESLTAHLTEINNQISNSDQSILDTFRSAVKALDLITNLPDHISNIKVRLTSLIEELSDLSREVEHVSNDIEYSPSLIEELTQRINLINSLSNKHHVSSTRDLLDLLSTWTKKLESFQSQDDDITKLLEEIEILEREIKSNAEIISDKRIKNKSKMESSIIGMLHDLEMKKAQFKVDIQPTDHINLHGRDDISYLFTANSGSKLQNIKNAASGGELSRLNLSLKSIVADKIDLQTMVLDEIDTGISGHVARKMGFMLKTLAQKHQIISITHSPQVAACGLHHIFVYKDMVHNKTQSRIKILSKDERIHNLAIMLSENPPSKAAIKNAEELINPIHKK